MNEDVVLSPADGWVGVRAPGRLHFGLLALPHDLYPTHWPDSTGQATLPRRNFGGAGLMIENPGLEVAIRRVSQWAARGPHAERFLAEGISLGRSLGTGPCEIVVQRCMPFHAGLGSGTQMALALVRALLKVHGLPEPAAGEMARIAGRGQRSAVGVHGFFQGGFLVEAGQNAAGGLGSRIARLPFPNGWRVIVAIPRGQEGVHGSAESRAFVDLRHREPDLAQTDAMCRLLLLGMLPAIEEQDLPAFGEALCDYNRRAGQMYRTVQSGPYAHPTTLQIVQLLRKEGIRGVGQSSWGPATFAVVEEDRGDWLRQLIQRRFGLGPAEVFCTRADNGGATFEMQTGPSNA